MFDFVMRWLCRCVRVVLWAARVCLSVSVGAFLSSMIRFDVSSTNRRRSNGWGCDDDGAAAAVWWQR